MLDRKERFFLINVLPAVEFELKHIPGSVNFPVEEPDFTQRVERATSGKMARIVVHGDGTRCKLAIQAAWKLGFAGFRDVSIFHGGIQEWEAAGHPLEGLILPAS